MELRNRLSIRKQDGFALTSESAPFWRRRNKTVFMLSGEIEAAARLAMHTDFDVRAFDAFCHCVEYSPCTLSRDSPLLAKQESPQYQALCQWLLDICRELIEPPMLHCEAFRTLSISGLSGEDLENGGGFLGCSTTARERFIFFKNSVLKARIWKDNGQILFQKLKLVATEYMDKIAPLCDSRFQVLCREPGARELLRFGDEILENQSDKNHSRFPFLAVVSNSSVFRPSRGDSVTTHAAHGR